MATIRHVVAIAVAIAMAFSPFATRRAAAAPLSFSSYAGAAMRTLERRWYADGLWRVCTLPKCRRENHDWGAAALTNVLHLRWETAHDASTLRYFAGLDRTFKRYGAPCESKLCTQWSDVPAWDAVAEMHVYEATLADNVFVAARSAYDVIDKSSVYALGACPAILYQRAFGGTYKLKTLETDSNLIEAGLLLYRFTRNATYLGEAIARYHAARRYYLDPNVPLYSVYVFDDGKACKQVRQRFFASANGNMIDAGLQLYHATNQPEYFQDAIATARAVDTYLSDGRNVFVDEQAENDITEPLVEAIYKLASEERQPFARAWILRNAAAAVSARDTHGDFGRFFNGPPPRGPVTAWQTNGGFALMIAAAALERDAVPPTGAWRGAIFVADEVRSLPATIQFTGSAIVLVGTIGEHCCELGRARVFIDGTQTFDRSGIWQNKSSSGHPLKDSILFVWRWRRAKAHTLRLEPGTPNAKEGGPVHPFARLLGQITVSLRVRRM